MLHLHGYGLNLHSYGFGLDLLGHTVFLCICKVAVRAGRSWSEPTAALSYAVFHQKNTLETLHVPHQISIRTTLFINARFNLRYPLHSSGYFFCGTGQFCLGTQQPTKTYCRIIIRILGPPHREGYFQFFSFQQEISIA